MKYLISVLFGVVLVFSVFSFSGAQSPPPVLGGAAPSVSPATPPPPAPPPPAPPPPPQVQPGLTVGAAMALRSAEAARPFFSPGKVWMRKAPGGEIEIKGGIVYMGRVVAVVGFDPATGDVLAVGMHPRAFSSSVSLEAVSQKLKGVVSGLSVLNGAEYRDPESAWAVPLAYEGKIVAYIKVSADGKRIVPDYPAEEEMRLFSRSP